MNHLKGDRKAAEKSRKRQSVMASARGIEEPIGHDML